MKITIETAAGVPVQKAWTAWTTPENIMKWNFASDDWQCPRAQIDLTPGGKFNYRMEAKDGSMGFDFEGEFTSIEVNCALEYSLGDDRKVKVEFFPVDEGTRIVETFEAEDEFSAEQQKQGWQSILNNFRRHVEAL